MKSNQLYVKEFLREQGLHDIEVDSIFLRQHKGRDGKSQPIVSMDDSHLLNTIRLRLVKRVKEHLGNLENEVKSDLLQGYAPDDMPAEIRRSLGLKKISSEKAEQVREKVEQLLETAHSAMLNRAIELTMPYIVVAATRAGCLQGLHEIMKEATGIEARVELPEYTTYATMTREEVLELTGGYPPREEDDLDFNNMGDLGFDPSREP